jgi:hypothetical protein
VRGARALAVKARIAEQYANQFGGPVADAAVSRREDGTETWVVTRPRPQAVIRAKRKGPFTTSAHHSHGPRSVLARDPESPACLGHGQCGAFRWLGRTGVQHKPPP